MITLLATLAWGQPVPEPVEPEHRGGGGRVAFSAFGGAFAGGMLGLVGGFVVGGIANQNVDCGTTNADCADDGGLAVAGAGAGLVVGAVTGAVLGGVIAANKVRRERVVVAPIGPGVPGLTVVGVF